jgi:hypothetical protein
MYSFPCSQEETEREARLQAIAGQLDRDAQEDFRLLIALTFLLSKDDIEQLIAAGPVLTYMRNTSDKISVLFFHTCIQLVMDC